MTDSHSTVQYREVPGFPNYRVGDDGSVWTRTPMGVAADGTLPPPKEWRKMSPGTGEWGHQQVRFCRDGKQFRFGVHRLVLELFVGPCPEGMEGCHFPDRDPRNNALSNLRWDTVANNKADMNIHGTHNKGDRNGRARLTEAIVREIRASSDRSYSRSCELAKRYNLSISAMRSVVSGETWKHVI